MARRLRGRNEGSVSRRSNGSWRAQVMLSGKRYSKDFSTKDEALAWIRKMQSQLDQGFDLNAGKITLEEFLQKWLDSSRIALRPRTIAQYESVIRMHIIPRLGKIPLKDLRPDRIELFISKMLVDGVGVRTIRLAHSVLHQALEKAIQYRILSYNPADNLSLPRYQAEEMKVLDESEVSAFLAAAHDSPLEAFYHLAVVTGMRQGELLGLKWGDLHWNSGTLYVQRQVQHLPGQGWTFQEPKTRNGRRAISLGEGTLQVLRNHRERQQQKKALAGSEWQEHDLMFNSNVGTPLDPSNMRRDFNRVLAAAGVPKIRFHDLRHTAASIMLNHGIPTIVVSRILGHSKPSITLDIYGHLMHEMQADAARVMDNLVTPIRVQIPGVEEMRFSFNI